MKAKRYKGSMVARDGRVIRVELWQEAVQPYRRVGSLEFPADEPLTVEWSARGKEEVIETSHATLRVISPGDRTYADLWEGEEVRMDVYIDGELWWSGTLDQEQYSEPYWTDRGYEVEMTFGDFGVLGRKRYHGAGIKSLGALVWAAVAASGIKTLGMNYSGVSIEPATLLSSTGVQSELWVDSDGEWATLETVLEDALGGLGLKIRQRGGRVWVYDMAGLGDMGEPRMVEWSAMDQTLSADRTYDKVKVRWSQENREGNLMEDDPWGDSDEPDARLTSYNEYPMMTLGYQYQSWPYIGAYFKTAWEAGFTLWEKTIGGYRGIEVTAPAKLVRVCAQLVGEDRQCVAVRWSPIWRQPDNMAWIRWSQQGCGASLLGDVDTADAGVLARTQTSHLCGGDLRDMYIKVSMDLCMTRRLSPYEDINDIEGFSDVSEYVDKWNQVLQTGYVPVNVLFRSTMTGKLYRWSNREVITARADSRVAYTAPFELGTWEEITDESALRRPTAWLMWYKADLYDGKEVTEGTFTGSGFTGNRQAVCQLARRLHPWLTKYGEGQLMWYPCDGPGDIWVEVLDTGWFVRKRDMPLRHSEGPNNDGARTNRAVCDNVFAPDIHNGEYAAPWILLGLPEVSVVRSRAYQQDLPMGDIETVETARGGGEEDLEVETRCGSGEKDVIMARGAYVDTATGVYRSIFERGSETGTAGELTARLLAKEYGTRKAKLTGETVPTLWSMGVYHDAALGDTLLWMSGETIRLREMEDDIELTETGIYGNE